MKKPAFINGYFYHIFNRGVDKRNIFLGDKDYRRFLFSVEDFNDVNSSINLYRRVNAGNLRLGKIKKDPMVKMVAYCLMPNHFHFILKQIKDKGISEFMRKLGTGYTNYFNQRYVRSGALFQGNFKAVLAEKDRYFNYLMQYLYLNPLDLIEPNWEEKGIKDFKKAKNFLKSYRWADCKNYDEYDEILREYSKGKFNIIKGLIIE